MRLLINLVVTVFTVSLCKASVIPHSTYGVPVPLVGQPFPHPGQLQLTTTPLHGTPQIITPWHGISHVIPTHGTIQTEKPLDLLQTLRAKEELIRRQIEELKSIEKYDLTSSFYGVPGGNFETQPPSDLLNILLAQLEIIQTQIQRLLTIQQIGQKIQDEVTITERTEQIPIKISKFIEDDLPKNTIDVPFRVEGETTFEKFPETEKTTDKPLDLLNTLIAQRDLVNLQIETFLKTQKGEGAYVPSEVYGAPYRTVGGDTKNNPTDWLSALVNHRDLLNLQISHILTIPGFENAFNGQFQILGTPNRKPTLPSNGVQYVQSPIIVPDTVQHSVIPTIVHQESRPIDDTVVAEQHPKHNVEIHIHHNEDSNKFTPESSLTEDNKISLDLISVLKAQRELIQAQINHLEKVREAEKKLKEQMQQFGFLVNNPTGTHFPTNKVGVLDDDSTELLTTLTAQRDSIDGKIEILKAHGNLELPNIPAYIQHELPNEFKLSPIQDIYPQHEEHFNAGAVLADVIRQRDLIERELALFLSVRRPQHLPDKYALLEFKRNLLNIQIEYLLAAQPNFINEKPDNVVVVPDYVYGVHQNGHTDDHFETSTTSETFTEDYHEKPLDLLRVLLAQSELIKIQLESLRAIEEAEKKVHKEMHNLGVDHHSNDISKHGTADLILAFEAQKNYVDGEIEKIMKQKGKIHELDMRWHGLSLTTEPQTMKPSSIEYLVPQVEHTIVINDEEKPLIPTGVVNVATINTTDVQKPHEVYGVPQ